MLLGFKKQFAKKILNGSKIHTFRNTRLVTPKPGETIHMYTGLRTKFTEFITKDHKYTGSQKVRMYLKMQCDEPFVTLTIGEKSNWTPVELHEMAISDGFENISDFVRYWLGKEKSLVWEGTCYHWSDFRY
jgi:hypothetical protein